jgi:DNA-binding NarL/FixJ family response regulator
MPKTGPAAKPLVASSPVRKLQAALIADAGPRQQISEVLEFEEFGFSTFDDIGSLVQRSPKRAPDVIVVSVSETASDLPGQLEPLRTRFPEVPVIVICPGVQRWSVRAALAGGAAAVLLFENLQPGLAPCVRAVLSGQLCVPRAHWRQVDPPALSSREKQILGLVVMGYMNSQIAARLFLAESTVKSHLSSAFGKLGVRSRNEAVKLIIDPERGLGMGILALGVEPVKPTSSATQ